jgi:hypothetical protein
MIGLNLFCAAKLFVDFKKVHDSIMWEVLYNILRVRGTHETREDD